MNSMDHKATESSSVQHRRILVGVTGASGSIYAERLIEKAKVLCRGMAQGIVYPNQGWQCSGCGFQARCKRWPVVEAAA